MKIGRLKRRTLGGNTFIHNDNFNWWLSGNNFDSIVCVWFLFLAWGRNPIFPTPVPFGPKSLIGQRVTCFSGSPYRFSLELKKFLGGTWQKGPVHTPVVYVSLKINDKGKFRWEEHFLLSKDLWVQPVSSACQRKDVKEGALDYLTGAGQRGSFSRAWGLCLTADL